MKNIIFTLIISFVFVLSNIGGSSTLHNHHNVNNTIALNSYQEINVNDEDNGWRG